MHLLSFEYSDTRTEKDTETLYLKAIEVMSKVSIPSVIVLSGITIVVKKGEGIIFPDIHLYAFDFFEVPVAKLTRAGRGISQLSNGLPEPTIPEKAIQDLLVALMLAP